MWFVKLQFVGFIIAVFLCVGAFGGSLVFAQAPFNVGSTISLDIAPRYPTPNSKVEVSLNAYTLDTTGASITWYVNGVRQDGVQNERSVVVTAGDLGVSMEVRAIIAPPNSSPLPVAVSFTPTVVDLVLESNTYVPSFYRGRALPSKMSLVRATAIPFVGSSDDPRSLTYEWALGGDVLFGGPIKGKQSIELGIPQFSSYPLSVVVYDSTGRALGRRSVSFDPVEPVLYFYENNPLRGLSGKAIGREYVLLGDEVTIHAVPYYMNTDLTPRTSIFEWTINGEPVSGNEQQNTITLRTVGEGGGEANIRLEALTRENLPQYLLGDFTASFR